MGGEEAQERRLEVMAALSRAGLAAARTANPDAIYTSVADSLRDAGFFVSIYAVEGEYARLVKSSFAEKAVKVVERHTNLRQDDFRVLLAEVPFYRRVLSAEDALLFDTAEVLGDVFPSSAKWLAGPVARVIKIRRGIGAAVRDEKGDAVALLFLLGNELTPRDVSTASVFAQLLGLTLGRARITRELEDNVSALQQAQQQLVQAQKIEAIGRLTGGIAHDFNNLLTPALFAVGELQGPALSPADHRECVDTIRQTLERCADLTRSLLAFGRRQVLTRRRVVLDDAVGSALRLLRATFQEHVRLEWAPGAGTTLVEADVTQLHQVMINLALNARDAMPGGGVFKVTTRVLPEGSVEIECADTGAGIAPSLQTRIFEPFFTTKGPGRGTGLGLSVVEGIVHQHGGTIAVESNEGAGTTFRIRMQAALAEAVQVRTTPVPVGPSSGQRLLVVEDDPLVRRTLVRILAARGYSIVEASSLAQARELRAKSPPFDLLVTDVVLPDGHSTDEAVALHRAGQRVLFVTGHPLDANWLPVEASRLPVLQKPFGPGELIAVVEAALRQ
ncbi:MAG: ATP-binding protein [Archangium sp.]|nr:ATP-binding protein [Archangium sp.]